MDSLKIAGAILGGIGLFLLAIGMMTDGLKLAAGQSLRTLLSEWSSTPLRGVFSGFLMTAIVQSSSAITVASIGFVNAGLINMRQALGIIYGANIGTTMTGWLVALVGFKFNIQAIALPMIGVGMVMKLVRPNGQLASLGLAIVGFGLFFVGIDILKSAFEGLVLAVDISKYTADGISGILLFVLIGIVMTILTQSSSASIALTITAASTDMIGIYAAGAMVIGASVGTTSTAMIASIGATSNAKRVAVGQVLINLATGLVALMVLPILFFLINKICEFFSINVNPGLSLALFHTVFSVLGVLLVYPQNERLASFLDNRFRSWDEKESHPRFLDNTIAQTPILAVNALILELQSIADKVIALFSTTLDPKLANSSAFANETKVIKALSSEVSKFIVSIKGSSLSEQTTANLTTLMRIDQYFLSCTLSAERVALQMRNRTPFNVLPLENDVQAYLKHVLGFMNSSRQNYREGELLNRNYIELQVEHDRIKAELILEGTRSNVRVAQMSETIDILGEVLRLSQQWHKAIKWMNLLQINPDDESDAQIESSAKIDTTPNI